MAKTTPEAKKKEAKTTKAKKTTKTKATPPRRYIDGIWYDGVMDAFWFPMEGENRWRIYHHAGGWTWEGARCSL